MLLQAHERVMFEFFLRPREKGREGKKSKYNQPRIEAKNYKSEAGFFLEAESYQSKAREKKGIDWGRERVG